MKQSNLCFVLLLFIAHNLVGECLLEFYANTNGISSAAPNASIVLLGGVLPIHHFYDDGSCGPLNDGNLQRAEAIAFAVNKINADPNLLPRGIKLAFYIRDSCLLVNTALDRTLDFITGSVAIGNNGTAYRVSGIIGETQSTISIAMASLLRLFRIPQISPFSTASELSDKTLYEYFLRIPPPDNYQSEVMVDLVEYFNWSYIIAINSADTYGRDGINQFIKILNSRNATLRCIAKRIEIPFPGAIYRDYDDAAAYFVDPMVINASAVVLYGHSEVARGLLDALARQNITRRLFWVGSDSWGDSLSGIYPKLLGNLISVAPKTKAIQEFDDYFQSLHISNHTSNPWFAEYWQHIFNCSLQNQTSSAFKPCDIANQRITLGTGYVQESFIPLAIEAVTAYAYAIRNLQMSLCNGSGLCKASLSTGDSQSRLYIPGDLLKPYLFNVSFQDQSGANFTFDKNGDPTSVLYTIKNLQITNDSFSYISIGFWSNSKPSSSLVFTQPVVWNNYQGSIVSRCSEPCRTGQYPYFVADCCWRCVDCTGNRDVSDGIGVCRTCDESFTPNQFRNACMPIDVTYYSAGHPGAIVILIISGLGILATISVTVIIIAYFTHKIIKATSREITAFLLVGIMLSYVTPFLFIIRPSPPTCAIRWIGVGLSFAISFSALLIRTIRIHRIFNRPLSSQKPLCLGSLSQVVLTMALIGVQVAIVVMWLVVEHPGVRYAYDVATGEILCNLSPYSAISVTIGYNALLLLATTYFAFRTRKVPKNFNETRYINVTVYSLMMIWVVLLPTYFGTATLGALYQTTSLLLTIVLSASVVLGAIFVPRLVYLFRTLQRNISSPDRSYYFEWQTVTKRQNSNITASKEMILCDKLEDGPHGNDHQERTCSDSSTQTE